MNYLAHMFLSFELEEFVVGQFIADEVKGSAYKNFKPGISEGILLHRFIDHYTDTHPACLELRAELRGEHGLFTPVVMDVFFDYALSNFWKTYSDKPLHQFIDEHYKILDANRDHLSDRMKYLLEVMIRRNWLARYETIEGINLTLNEMSSRIKSPNTLKTASQSLVNQHERIMSTFNAFFPTLLVDSKTKFNTFATYLSKNR